MYKFILEKVNIIFGRYQVERGDSILFGQEESNDQVLGYFHVFEELYVRVLRCYLQILSS
jgi:hypothetical protein